MSLVERIEWSPEEIDEAATALWESSLVQTSCPFVALESRDQQNVRLRALAVLNSAAVLNRLRAREASNG